MPRWRPAAGGESAVPSAPPAGVAGDSRASASGLRARPGAARWADSGSDGKELDMLTLTY